MNLTADDTADIKQLFVANNQLLLMELDKRLDAKLGTQTEEISRKFDDLKDFMLEAITTSNDANGEQQADYDRRITKLEKATA